ncbi:hypothetical protein J6590_099669, partial [Homalodisca vitripennis]
WISHTGRPEIPHCPAGTSGSSVDAYRCRVDKVTVAQMPQIWSPMDTVAELIRLLLHTAPDLVTYGHRTAYRCRVDKMTVAPCPRFGHLWIQDRLPSQS